MVHAVGLTLAKNVIVSRVYIDTGGWGAFGGLSPPPRFWDLHNINSAIRLYS